MTVTQYIGARYVPLFADPLDWDIQKEYEPLTIVYWQGNSYTSRQAVPKGIDISNEEYWALTGNYNAQIEQYRREVIAYDGRISENAAKIAKEIQDRMAADNTIQSAIDKEAQDRAAADNALSTRLTSAESTLSKLGTASKKNWTDSVTSSGTDLPTSGSVYTAIENAKTSVKNDLKKKSHMIVIGDSFSVNDGTSNSSEGPLWHEIVGNVREYTVHSYATNGTGFTLGSKTFVNQTDEAIAEFKGKEDTVACVAVCGGWNDARAGDFDTLTDSAIKVFGRLLSAFPNAEKVAMMGNTFRSGISQTGRAHTLQFVAERLCFFAQARGFRAINICTLGLGESSYYKNTTGHPSQYYEAALASVFLGETNVLGSKQVTFPFSELELDNGTYYTTNPGSLRFNNGHGKLNFMVTATAANMTFRIPFRFKLETPTEAVALIGSTSMCNKGSVTNPANQDYTQIYFSGLNSGTLYNISVDF